MTRFVFINDDKEAQKQWKEWAERKKYEAYTVDNLLEAVEINADFYVFDISCVAPVNLMHTAYSPICTLIERYPGSIVMIVSGISKQFVEDIIDEVKERTGHTVIYGGWGTFKEFEEAISNYV